MSTGYQIEDQWGTYFVTTTVVDWVDVFTRKRYQDMIIDSLNFCVEQKGLRIFGDKLLAGLGFEELKSSFEMNIDGYEANTIYYRPQLEKKSEGVERKAEALV